MWQGCAHPMSRLVRTSAAYATTFAAIGAAWPFLPVYYRSLGFDLHTVGSFTALAAATQLIAAPLWGTIADRFPSSRLVLPASAIGAAVAAGALAVVREPALVVVTIIALFAAGAGILPMLDTHALDVVAADRDRYGRLRVWGSVAFIVAVSLVGWIVDRVGIHGLFLVYVPAHLATALVTASFQPVTAGIPSVPPRLESLRALVRQPRLMRFFAASLLGWSALMAVNAFFSIHLVALGAPALLVGSAWALGALVEVPIMWAFPALAARLGGERLLIVGAVLFVVRALLVAWVHDPLMLVATMTIAGAGFALLLVAGITHASRLAPEGAAATTQAVFSSVSFGLAMIVGSLTGGFLADALGIMGMALVAAGASAVAVGGYALALRSSPASRTPIIASQQSG
jgi:PPP family 3-phenylpropionic acid transporter